MTHPDPRTAGDLAASVASAIVFISHWSQIVTPIIALLVGLLTLVWWTIRLWDRFREGNRNGRD